MQLITTITTVVLDNVGKKIAEVSTVRDRQVDNPRYFNETFMGQFTLPLPNGLSLLERHQGGIIEATGIIAEKMTFSLHATPRGD